MEFDADLGGRASVCPSSQAIPEDAGIYPPNNFGVGWMGLNPPKFLAQFERMIRAAALQQIVFLSRALGCLQ